jgi:hypothetical protein
LLWPAGFALALLAELATTPVAPAVPAAAAISAITATTIAGDGNRRNDCLNILPPLLVMFWVGDGARPTPDDPRGPC